MDERPSTADSPRSQQPTRRNFSVAAIYGLWAAIMAVIGLPAVGYLLIPSKIRRKDEWVDATDVTGLTPRVPLEVTFRRNRVDGWRVVSEKSTAWVVKLASNDVVAFAPQCTHLGCAYHWDQRRTQFVCPCHNSVFSVEGNVQEGPAPRPLDRFQTKLEGNKLLLGPIQISSSRTV